MRSPTTITRRRLLALLPAVAASLHGSLNAQGHIFSRKPKPRPSTPQGLVFFGTDTVRSSAKGIYLSHFDPSTGHLSTPVLAAETVRPSFFAFNQLHARRFLYTVNEGEDEHTSGVSTYLVDAATGGMKLLGQVSAGGAGPCYIAVDATGSSAYVANYGGGTIASFLIQPDGTLSQPVERIDFRDAKLFGQPAAAAPHPHSSMFSPDNRFLIVNDLGNDAIATFSVDVATARLGAPHLFKNRSAGAGPRHLAFHPNSRWAYGIDELSSKIDQYLWNTTRGTKAMAPEALLTDTGHTVSTLDPGFRGTNSAAEIKVATSGSFVYASNRGEDSIAVFRVDASSGALSLLQSIACGGKAPRHFTFDPSGRWLLCGNQDSGTITVLACNPGTGQLSGPVQTLPLEAPQFSLFV